MSDRAEELLRWADTYGEPEEWAKRAQAAHARAERLQEERDELDRECNAHLARIAELEEEVEARR